MKIVRLRLVDGSVVYAEATAAGPLEPWAADHRTEFFTELRGPFPHFTPTKQQFWWPEVAELLAPIEPTLLVVIGANYREHARKLNITPGKFPVVLFRSPSTVNQPFGTVRLPTRLHCGQLDYEAELAVVLGRPCLNATADTALPFIFGYTATNDFTARDWQGSAAPGGQFGRSKHFDGFCPLGPCLVTADELPDPGHLAVRSWVNGQPRQNGNTADFIFSLGAILEHLSADCTLPAGTVILTGSPFGTGSAQNPAQYLVSGDVVTVEVEGIGHLRHEIVS